MTEAQVLALINQFIIANGNNDITADVLRPILVAILEQPNDKVGELSNLNTTDQTNIVNAVNEVLGSIGNTFTIHSGSDDPNVIPPSTYSIGDWYILGGTLLYQYNGYNWILLKTDNNFITIGNDVFRFSKGYTLGVKNTGLGLEVNDTISDGNIYINSTNIWIGLAVYTGGVITDYGTYDAVNKTFTGGSYNIITHEEL